jgi:hypothetical protein
MGTRLLLPSLARLAGLGRALALVCYDETLDSVATGMQLASTTWRHLGPSHCCAALAAGDTTASKELAVAFPDDGRGQCCVG